MYRIIPNATSADRHLDYVENCIAKHSKELESLNEQLKKTINPFKKQRIKSRMYMLKRHLKLAHIQEKILTEYIFTQGK